MPSYRISKKAEKDLENIWVYSAEKWSVGQANKYLNLIFKEFNTITKNPELGLKYSKISEEYLGSKVKSHIVFYRVSTDEWVDIIRILHQRMDLKSRLKD